MTKANQIYKCEVCGNIVEILHSGNGQLVCCGENMTLIKTKTTDEGREKHLPVIVKDKNEITINVGSVPHPMEDEHYIEWIEVITDKAIYRTNLNPGDNPTAKFTVDTDRVSVRAYCNIHGLWESEL